MHHKRGKRKNARAGCLMCKPHKMNGAGALELSVHKKGFGNVRAEVLAKLDEKEVGGDGSR